MNNKHSFEEIKKILKDSGYFPIGDVDETGFILPDGDFLNTADNTYGMYWHNTVEAFLQDNNLENVEAEEESAKNDSGDGSPTLEAFGAIRVSGGENYICLPPIRPTEAAFDTLNRWLDNYLKMWNWSDVTPPIYVCNYKGNVDNSYDATDDIVRKIKQYYGSGRLVEGVNSNIKQKLYNFLKSEIGLSKQPNMEGASYILEDGSFIQINDGPWKDNDRYDTHGDFDEYIKYRLFKDEDSFITGDYLIDKYLNPIRVNNQEEYINLSKTDKPTPAQLRALMLWLDEYYNYTRRNFKYMMANPDILQIVFGFEHEAGMPSQAGINIIDYDSKDIINFIGNYYLTGRIPPNYEFNEELSSMTVYHGTDIHNITKFDHEQNWFSPSWDYAHYYAVSLNDTGYIYKCEIKLGKNLNVGRTGLNVYNPLRPIQPYILTNDIKGLFKKVDIIDEKTIRTILDNVAKEFNLKYNGYQMKLSTVIRSKVFIDLLKNKGYDSVSAIEYCVPTRQPVNTYGILNPSLIKIIDREEVHFGEESSSENLDENIIHTEKFDVLYTNSPYEVKNKLFASKEAMRVFIDATHEKSKEDIYLVGNAYECIHTDMLDALWETNYIGIDWNDVEDKQIAIVYVPDEDEYGFTVSDAVDDNYDTMYIYDNFTIYSRYTYFKRFELYRIMGKPNKIVLIDEDYVMKVATGQIDEAIEYDEITPEQVKDMLKWLMEYFKNNTKEYIGDACYITPDGTYINLDEYHESGENAIELYCYQHDLPEWDDYEKKLGLIHCSSFYYSYVFFPMAPTKAQIEALSSFEDYQADKKRNIELDCGKDQIKLFFDEATFNYVDKNGVKTSIAKELKKYYRI